MPINRDHARTDFLHDDRWVRVTGRYTGTELDTNHTSKLAATAVTVIDQPANPYDH
jgi:uncharacterized membrane protein YcgQ (UPF0703/DUF1980 family)